MILISHGPFSKAVLEAAELICGEQDRVKTYGLYLGDSVDEFRDKIREGIEESLTRGDVLVLTDIQSGSPFNVTCAAMGELDFYHITGMNLPLVIEVLMDRIDMSIDEVIECGMRLGKVSIVDVNKLLDGYFDEDD